MNGLRREIDIEKVRHRAFYDIDDIDRRSFWPDAKIKFITTRKPLMLQNAY